VLILLPPSEGKTAPASGPTLDLEALSFPRLTSVRGQVSRALVRLAGTRRAAEVLGLGPTQADAIDTDARLFEVPCAPAGEVYTGVLFGELDLGSLDATATARAQEQVAVASALFGLVRVGDPIPAYRLSGTVTLPRLGPVAARWRPVVPRVLDEEVGDGLLVDLRSGTYVGLGKPSASLAPRTATVRVLHEQDGRRTVVSHFNKATKGRLVRALLQDGAGPATVDELAGAWRDLGFTVEQEGTRVDVVTTGDH
jgi:cytoplasmic iron level regulating protein YaaA (DUF328/UPF0246 family)